MSACSPLNTPNQQTTLIVEIMMPTASTETTVPKIHWALASKDFPIKKNKSSTLTKGQAIKGVATMHKRVVDIVINTLKATSPPALTKGVHWGLGQLRNLSQALGRLRIPS